MNCNMRRRESVAANWHKAGDIAEFVKTAEAHIINDINPNVNLPRKTSADKDKLIETYLRKAEARDDVVNQKLVKQIIVGDYDLSIATLSKHAVNDPLIPPEREWLSSHPDTDEFNDIRQRVFNSKRHMEDLVLSTTLAQQYFAHDQDKTNLKQQNLPGYNAERDAVLVGITQEFLNEVLSTMIPSICSELLYKSKTSLDVLNRSFIKAMTNFSDQNKRFLKMSGRIDVLKGALLDIEDQYRFDHLSDIKKEDSTQNYLLSRYNVALSQSLLDIKSTAPSSSDKVWKPVTTETISLIPENYVHDTIITQPLLHAEEEHVGQLSLQLVKGAPLTLPSNIPGRATLVKTFKQMNDKKNSILLVGTTKGRLLIYDIPWNADTPKLVAISPKAKDKKEREKLIDIKISPVGPQMIILMNGLGSVFVYHLNQAIEVHTELSKTGLKNNKKNKGGFFSSLFGSRNTNNMDLLELNLLFKINKYDVTLAVPLTKTIPNPYEKVVVPVLEDINPANKSQSTVIMNKISNAILQSNAIVLDKDMVPCKISFHPTLSLMGRPTSFMIGTSGGDIVKYNLDYHTALMNCKLVYPTNVTRKGVSQGTKNLPLPFVDKEYIHYHDAPSGFVLTSGNRENKGNRVYRELFHYHKSPIILLDILKGLSDSLISIDEEGYMALWRYSSDCFQEKQWFQPQTKTKLDLLHKQYITVGDPIRSTSMNEPVVPTPDEMMQLRRRHRGYDGKNHNVVVDIYYPLFNSSVNSFIQYVCFTVTETRLPPRAKNRPTNAVVSPRKMSLPPVEENHSVPEHPEMSPRSRIDPSTMVIEIPDIDTPQPADEVPPLVLNPVTNDVNATPHPKRDATHFSQASSLITTKSSYWSYQIVKERNHPLKIESSIISNDGCDIVMMLSSEAAGEAPAKSSRSRKLPPKLTTYYFVVIHTLTLQFHNLHPHLVVDSSVDQLLDYCVGPVMAETLSRLIFVLTKKDGIRVFSLETGTELHCPIQGGFPFIAAVKSFQPTKLSICHSQRVLTLYSADDSRIAVYVIKHSKDGQSISLEAEKQSKQKAVYAPVNKLNTKRTEEYLRSLSYDTIMDILVIPPDPLSEAELEVNNLLDEIIEKVFAKAENNLVRKHQTELLASLYGPSPYGFIEPTVWPPPEVEPVREETPRSLESESDDSVESVQVIEPAVAPEDSGEPVGTPPDIIIDPTVTADLIAEPAVDSEENDGAGDEPPRIENEAKVEPDDYLESIKRKESEHTLLGICVMALEDIITAIILNEIHLSKATLPDTVVKESMENDGQVEQNEQLLEGVNSQHVMSSNNLESVPFFSI